MIGYVALAYWLLALIGTYQLGINLEGGSFILGAICAFWGGCGARGMWYHGRLLLGLTLGASVTAIGFFATHYTGVVIYVAGEPYPADWLVLGSAILFFFITPKEAAEV